MCDVGQIILDSDTESKAIYVVMLVLVVDSWSGVSSEVPRNVHVVGGQLPLQDATA
jgi:hypothetical protein